MEKVHIHNNANTNAKSHYYQCKVGDRAMSFMNTLKLNDQDKSIILNEACDILGRCIPPNKKGEITNIAVGYIQSGKTLSFTTLTALAADNGYDVIIYLTGTKTNLQKQTYRRLVEDLNVNDGEDNYFIFDISLLSEQTKIKRNLPYLINERKSVLLFPILKQYIHINSLIDIFNNIRIKNNLDSLNVIIVDDEADQASFNTFAKSNSKKEDWEDDDFSRTYESILKLRGLFNSLSYVQYTATPQAAFLIDNNDLLSPKYCTLLTPGNNYCGGKFFFKEENNKYLELIPNDDIYDRKNPLTRQPQSLKNAFCQFIISVAIVVFLQKRKNFLSMMVHIDGIRDSNEKFKDWIDNNLRNYLSLIQEGKYELDLIKNDFKTPYNSISRYIDDCPTFEDVINVLPKVLLHINVKLIQAGSDDNDIDWNEETGGYILVGGEMLNRGFTIENLSMSYLQRTAKGKSNADTIEQRCRFFGYKKDYADVCRIFLTSKNKEEFTSYVKHEEALRQSFKECSDLTKFKLNKSKMALAESLNPTRTNILSSKLVRYKMNGWHQLVSFDFINENNKVFEAFISKIEPLFKDYKDYLNPIRNHRIAKVNIDDAKAFLKSIKYNNPSLYVRKITTLSYMDYLKENGIDYVDIIQIAYQCEKNGGLRERTKKENKTINLHAGKAINGSYPGDKKIKTEDTINFQLHHIRINEKYGPYDKKDIYNLAIYYPESLAISFVGTEEEDF